MSDFQGMTDKEIAFMLMDSIINEFGLDDFIRGANYTPFMANCSDAAKSDIGIEYYSYYDHDGESFERLKTLLNLVTKMTKPKKYSYTNVK